MTERSKIPVAAVVMTKNEESNIASCLGSLERFAQVVVVDSWSDDETVRIAEDHGAEVVHFEWNGEYPKKKEWCRRNLQLAHQWVLYLDADERIGPELEAEIREVVTAENDVAGYFVFSDMVFLGRRLRHGMRTKKLILFRRDKGYFPDVEARVANMWEVEGHYQPVIEGPVGELRSPLVHHDAKDLFSYFDRHNRYSDWEAALREQGRHRPRGEAATMGRGVAKRVFDLLPLKGLAIFLYSFVWKRGFLDGGPGFHYAMFRAFYYWQIQLKRRSLREEAARSQV